MSTTIDTVKVQSYLAKLFSQVISEDEINNYRRRAFATIANYTSPVTGETVGSVLTNEQIGNVLNSVRDYHINKRIQAVASQLFPAAAYHRLSLHGDDYYALGGEYGD